MASGNPQATASGDLRAVAAARFLALVEPKLAATEALFRDYLGSDVPFIQDAGEYIFHGGGKRVRPALLLLSARLLGLDSDEEVTYAAAVELIHTATLIHDDVIDHAGTRRGQVTVNHRWGNSRTVLLGDWLYTTAMRESLRFGNVEVIRALCDATRQMTEGELLALERLAAVDLTVEEYFSIVERKTARLFAAACSLPSLIRPARPEAGDALARYGRALGICFQLVDDLLDFTARSEELGKPVLADLKEGKLTLPLLLVLPRLNAAERASVAAVLKDGAFERVPAAAILELIEREGTLEETRQVAREHARGAREALAFFPVSPAREALELAPDFVLDRRT
ncbi:MAG: polyprenyl synthetase family protein [Thermoanaerobaculia bacterium]